MPQEAGASSGKSPESVNFEFKNFELDPDPDDSQKDDNLSGVGHVAVSGILGPIAPSIQISSPIYVSPGMNLAALNALKSDGTALRTAISGSSPPVVNAPPVKRALSLEEFLSQQSTNPGVKERQG